MAKKIGRNDPCWCGSGRKYKVCHESFDRKIEMYKMQGHKVPTQKMIKTPEQVALICSTILNGYFSDSSRMFKMGNVSPENKKLVETVKESIYLGLEQVKPWNFLGDMGQVINDNAKLPDTAL